GEARRAVPLLADRFGQVVECDERSPLADPAAADRERHTEPALYLSEDERPCGQRLRSRLIDSVRLLDRATRALGELPGSRRPAPHGERRPGNLPKRGS